MSFYRSTTNTIVHEAALRIADRGKPDFPCDRKRPLTKRGHKDATTDKRRINAWWKRWPDANIGVPTGKLSGFFVVDVDRLEALGELPRELPETLTIRTPSGGLHLYFTHVDGLTNRTGSLPDGIDIRAEGGYVIVPPSEGYAIARRAPIAPAPEWLVEKLREKPAATVTAITGDASKVDLDSIAPIEEGTRNNTFASIGGGLRARGWDQPAIEEELLRINAARCTKPLPEDEVRKIAASVARYPAGKAGPDAETLQALDEVERDMWGVEYKGIGGKTERDLEVALIKEGRRHSHLVPGGVEVSMSVRGLALAAAVSKRSAGNGIERMYKSGRLRRGRRGAGKRAGTFILPLPSAKVAHSTTWLSIEQPTSSSGLPSRSPFTAPRLRWSAPEMRRLGKTCGAVIDYLEKVGGSASLRDIAAAVDISRPWDLKRRDGVIPRLKAAAVVECAGDIVSLVGDWLENLDLEREGAGEIAAYRRDMERYNREREAYSKRRVNKPERAPTQVEMDEYQATRPPLVGDAIRAHVAIMNPNTKPGQVYATVYGADLDMMACAIAAHFGDSRGDPRAWKRWLDPVAQALTAMDGEPREKVVA